MSKVSRIAGLVLLFAALIAPASAEDAKPVLTIYTYGGFVSEYGPGPVITERFETECGCTLEWATSDDGGTLLSRLKLEGEGTKADVVLGLDNNLLAEAKETSLFQPHEIDAAVDLPVEWTDDTFVPFDWGWFAFVYDAKRLADPPASLEELVESTGGPSIVIQDPRTSTPGLGLLVWMREVYGDRTADAWKALAPKIVTVTQGWSEAYGLFLKGEADMVLSYTTSPAYHISAEGTDQYRAAIFPEGHALQVEVAAITKVTDDEELARRFLRFMLSDEFQSAIPEHNWMYPAAAQEAELPASFKSLPQPERSLLTPSESVATNRRAWVDEWLSALSR